MKSKLSMVGFPKALFPGLFLVSLLGIALFAKETKLNITQTLTPKGKEEASNRPAFAVYCENYYKSMRMQTRINDLEEAIARDQAALDHPGSDKLLVWLNKKDTLEKNLAMNNAQLGTLKGQFEFARIKMIEAERS
jgi:hypothetical protein